MGMNRALSLQQVTLGPDCRCRRQTNYQDGTWKSVMRVSICPFILLKGPSDSCCQHQHLGARSCTDAGPPPSSPAAPAASGDVGAPRQARAPSYSLTRSLSQAAHSQGTPAPTSSFRGSVGGMTPYSVRPRRGDLGHDSRLRGRPISFAPSSAVGSCFQVSGIRTNFFYHSWQCSFQVAR